MKDRGYPPESEKESEGGGGEGVAEEEHLEGWLFFFLVEAVDEGLGSGLRKTGKEVLYDR